MTTKLQGMWTHLAGVGGAAIICMGVLAADAAAQPRERGERGRDHGRNWVELGCKEVSIFERDKDTIRVGRREGQFSAIRLSARGSDVEIMRLTVDYTRGDPDNIDVQRVIRRGERTDPLDLRGRERSIDKIELVYRQIREGRRRATVCVEGLAETHAGGGDGGRRWVELGCKEVSFLGRDRDTIGVGRREGRFRAIRLSARGNDVEMLRLKVVYASGDPDEIDVQRVIRQGDRTDPLDLRGRERAIDSIEMVYRQRLNFRGRATVCAEGLD